MSTATEIATASESLVRADYTTPSLRRIIVAVVLLLAAPSIGAATPTRPCPTGEIWAIYVSPATIGLGVERVLFAQACGKLEHCAFTLLSLWVLERNKWAGRSFGIAGFKPDASSRKTVCIVGVELVELRYIRATDAGPLER